MHNMLAASRRQTGSAIRSLVIGQQQAPAGLVEALRSFAGTPALSHACNSHKGASSSSVTAQGHASLQVEHADATASSSGYAHASHGGVYQAFSMRCGASLTHLRHEVRAMDPLPIVMDPLPDPLVKVVCRAQSSSSIGSSLSGIPLHASSSSSSWSQTRSYAVNNKPDVSYIRAKQQHLDQYTHEPTNYVELLGCIKHCGTMHRLHHLVTQYADVFDAVHVAAALAVLPKVTAYRPQDLEPTNAVLIGAGVEAFRPKPGAKIREGHAKLAEETASLLDAMLPAHMARFFPRQCAATVWAFGQLANRGVYKSVASLNSLLYALKANDFQALRVHGNAVDAAQLLKGLASLDHRDEALVNMLAEMVTRSASVLKARELQMVLTALASLGYTEQSTYSVLAERVVQCAAHFTPEGISKITWAYAAVGCNDAKLLESLAAGLAPQNVLIAPNDIAVLMSAYGRMQYGPEPVLALLGDAAARMVGRFSDESLANALAGFARLGQRHAAFFDVVSRSILQEPELGSSSSPLIKALAAYARLADGTSSELDAAACRKVVSRLAQKARVLDAGQVASVCRSMIKLSIADEECAEAFAKRACDSAFMASLSAQQLLALLKVYNSLPVEPRFQLAVTAARHLGSTLCTTEPKPEAFLLSDCLYQCLQQGVHDQQAATAVLDAVLAAAQSGGMTDSDAAARAVVCAQRMSCGTHAAVPTLKKLLVRAPANEELMQQVTA